MFLQKSYQVINLKMNNIRTIKGGVNLKGKVKVPGDKSISHRALIIGSIAEGETTIEGFLHSEDPLSTADCLRKLGVNICLLYTSPSPRDLYRSRMPSSA